MYRIAALAGVLFISGCAGLAVGTYGKKESVKTHFALAETRNEFSHNFPDSAYLKADIIKLWGEPDELWSTEKCEVLVFDNGTSWAGAGAFIGFIPVPLAVPTGTYKNRFYVREGKILGLIQEYGEVDRAAGYMCGSNECEALRGEKVNKPEIDADIAIKSWCS
ncbi:hypothetical protein ACFSJ3_03130 [Corallincola platygyrae]|uniref:Lipoprotein n=1 Tax=Corallincola platygyrae TaxID=1193278 RepID=A0ABW4XJV3_9GAMM